jgi:hypothetical protein
LAKRSNLRGSGYMRKLSTSDQVDQDFVVHS